MLVPVSRLLSGCSAGLPKPRVPGVSGPFSQGQAGCEGELQAMNKAASAAAALGKLEFQAVLSAWALVSGISQWTQGPDAREAGFRVPHPTR